MSPIILWKVINSVIVESRMASCKLWLILALIVISENYCQVKLSSSILGMKEKLRIYEKQITINQTEFDFNELSSKIEVWAIEDSKIDPHEIVITKSYRSLEILIFKNCSLTKFDIQNSMYSLQELDLSVNLLEDVSFLGKVSLISLQRVNLRDNRLSTFKNSYFNIIGDYQSYDISNNDICEIEFSRWLCFDSSQKKLRVSKCVAVINNCRSISVIRDSTPAIRPHRKICSINLGSNSTSNSTTTGESTIALYLYIIIPIVAIVIVIGNIITIIKVCPAGKCCKSLVSGGASSAIRADYYYTHQHSLNPYHIYSPNPVILDANDCSTSVGHVDTHYDCHNNNNMEIDCYQHTSTDMYFPSCE